jgi:hypothetical protein
MHPIFAHPRHVLLYLSAWLPLGLLLWFAVTISGHLSRMEGALVTVPQTLVLAFVCLSPWYMCRSLPLLSTPPWKLLTSYLLAAVCVNAVLSVVARFTIAMAGRQSPGFLNRIAPVIPALTVMIVLLYLLSTALHYAWLAVESSRRAEILSREAELKALKAQINPHFLFNSLNSISALATIDPLKAREMCIRLSDFLRTSLRLGEKTSVLFGEELELTKAYLDVEQIRFGRRLRIVQDFDPACALCEMPPMLVQPLVENAIKHGIATLVDGGEIALTGRKSPDGMRLTIANPYDPDAPAAGKTGFGLAIVRNRLTARYGAAARLEIQADGSRYSVSIGFPCPGGTRAANNCG